MGNYEQVLISITCPHCGKTTQVPGTMAQYNWNVHTSHISEPKVYPCFTCGKDIEFQAKRHVYGVHIITHE